MTLKNSGAQRRFDFVFVIIPPLPLLSAGMGLCSSQQPKQPKPHQPQPSSSTPNPVSDPNAPAHIENPEGITILDHSTAHLENNENDGGALEVYLDDEGNEQSYQTIQGQTAEPTKRRPSMIIPPTFDFPGKMDPAEVVCGTKIGSGSFGEVVHAHYHGYHIAIKKCFVPRDPKEFREVYGDFKREVTLLSNLKHPRILRYVSKVCDIKTKTLWIATEVMAGSVGTLLKMIHNSGGSHMLSWRLILQIMADAAEAMTFLHGVNIIHRDLKAENLLLDEDFRCKVSGVWWWSGVLRCEQATKTLMLLFYFTLTWDFFFFLNYTVGRFWFGPNH